MPESLEKRYQGPVAATYDSQRSTSPRWRNENAAFDHFLDCVKPAVILDCPFGTGRWIPAYDRIQATVHGVDISADMLQQAGAKRPRTAGYTLTVGSIFDYDFSAIQADLAVCVRFLNWVPFDKAMQAVSRLGLSGAGFLVAGCSVIPAGAGAMTRLCMKTVLAARNIRAGGKTQYVHDESAFIEGLRERCWKMEARRLIFRNASRCNYFYLFSRMDPVPGARCVNGSRQRSHNEGS
ncbi:MAG: class I SAM-dependent methyltransferase [Candidatus Marinimicrobia bacterium]|nr:class I SAM-dependent methyltransferase [Candidatus Neomarinimicrobiota bacterium]